MTDDRLEKLRLRRMAQAEERERMRLRKKNGATILGVMREVLGADLHEVTTTECYPQAELAKKIEESNGLVAAYVSYSRARQIVSCCQAVLGNEVSTNIRFDEKSYMGTFACTQLKLPVLVDLAMKLQDRVLAAPIGSSAILVIDYYALSWTTKQADFSIILQGPGVESIFKNCFVQQSPLHSRLLGSQDRTEG